MDGEFLQEVGAFQKASDVSDLMPCELEWKIKTCFIDFVCIFWSRRPKDELHYQHDFPYDG